MNVLIDLISAGLGIALSASLALIPPFRRWFQSTVSEEYRGLVMVGLSIVVPFAIYGLSCLGLFNWVTCDNAGVQDLARAFLAFLFANQSIFLTVKKLSYKQQLREQEKLQAVER